MGLRLDSKIVKKDEMKRDREKNTTPAWCLHDGQKDSKDGG